MRRATVTAALLIFDETAICLGRLGTMYGFENFGVVPDIVTLGKGLGGGVFPLAAMIARRDFDQAGNIRPRPLHAREKPHRLRCRTGRHRDH